MSVGTIAIFCRVIDNYGDIGVCWRLARRLYALSHARVMLCVDDLEALARIVPDYQSAHYGVLVYSWTDEVPVAELVIEAFACHLPEVYQERMQGQTRLWLNLEYLSAESWVESVHLLPSPQSNGVSKYFFFPGFTSKTGGLLRETDALLTKPLYLKSVPWLAQELIDLKAQGKRLFFCFSYPTAPILALLASLPEDVVLLMPQHAPIHPQVKSIPFVSQSDFDELLQFCDMNFVRGEDSLVRAIWAGKPFLWQIYKQEEDVHLDKLNAWLDKSLFSDEIVQQFQAWNGVGQFHWKDELYLSWYEQTQLFRSAQADILELGAQIMYFYTSKTSSPATPC